VWTQLCSSQPPWEYEWKDLHHFSYDTQQVSWEKKEQNCGAIQKTEWLHWVGILSFELPHEQQKEK